MEETRRRVRRWLVAWSDTDGGDCDPALIERRLDLVLAEVANDQPRIEQLLVSDADEAPVPGDKGARHRLDAIAYSRSLSLFAQIYGEEGWPRAPGPVQHILSYALDLALGIVAWPSSEATRVEESIVKAVP